MLEEINGGEFDIAGLHNRDLRGLLYPRRSHPQEEDRRAAKVTRKLSVFRAHRVLRPVSGTHRCHLTEKGRRIVTALLTARQADVVRLTKLDA